MFAKNRACSAEVKTDRTTYKYIINNICHIVKSHAWHTEATLLCLNKEGFG